VGLAPTGKRRLFTAHTRNGHQVGNPLKRIGPLASLSNKQRDGLSVAEVLKRNVH
jgi:hypothetical protein